MKVNSSVIPSKFYIRKLETGIAFIRLRDNINKITRNEDGKEEIIFEYDEVEIKISDRANIEVYIEDNFNQLFKMGKLEESKPPKLTINNRIDELEMFILTQGGLI